VAEAMTKTKMPDGTIVFCIQPAEAKVLDSHIEGYMTNGIRVEPGDTVFDVGANIGLFGIRMAQRCDGDITIFAFEPIPAIRACTARNLESWQRATVLPYGVSEQPGEATFTYYPHAPSLSTAHTEDWDNQDEAMKSAIVGNAQNAPMWYAKFFPSFLAGFMAKWMVASPETFICQLRPLSDIVTEHNVKRIDLLKVDCEGAEEAALLGLRAEHWPMVQQAVIEVHDIDGRLNRIVGLLQSNGLTEITIEKEAALKNTQLSNVYAHRPRINE
jgi:FkbM family methyltransferase